MASNFSLVGSLRVSPTWVEPLDASTVTDSVTALVSFALSNGTGAGQANAYWRDLISVGAGITTTINLTSLPMNVFGTAGTLNLGTPKLLLVRNRSASIAVQVALGQAAQGDVGPGGVLLATNTAAGWGDTSLVILNPGAAAVSVEVYIAGVRA